LSPLLSEHEWAGQLSKHGFSTNFAVKDYSSAHTISSVIIATSTVEAALPKEESDSILDTVGLPQKSIVLVNHLSCEKKGFMELMRKSYTERAHKN
jgi:hypothetical protein